MEIAPELQDAHRLALMERLHNAVRQISVNSSAWAFLWFSDIAKLENMVRRAELGGSDDLGGVIAKISSVGETTSAIQTWSTNARPYAEESPKKRSSDELATPRAPSPSKIPRLHKDKQDLDTEKASISSAPISPTKEQKSPPKMPRSRSARKFCMERDKERCVITRAGEPVEVAHIYPYCLGQQEEKPDQFLFWSILEWFWSEEKVKTWKRAVFGPQGTEICSNMLCLGSNVHGLWGMARFSLKPIELSEDQKTLKVKFFWLPSPGFSRRVQLTMCPALPQDLRSGPKDTKLLNCHTEKIIESGDEITLHTDNPEIRPLPSVALLEMQWMLNRVKAISGAAEIPDDELDPDQDFLFGKITEGLLDEDSSDDEPSEAEFSRKAQSHRFPARPDENRRSLSKSPKRRREKEDSEPPGLRTRDLNTY